MLRSRAGPGNRSQASTALWGLAAGAVGRETVVTADLGQLGILVQMRPRRQRSNTSLASLLRRHSLRHPNDCGACVDNAATAVCAASPSASGVLCREHVDLLLSLQLSPAHDRNRTHWRGIRRQLGGRGVSGSNAIHPLDAGRCFERWLRAPGCPVRITVFGSQEERGCRVITRRRLLRCTRGGSRVCGRPLPKLDAWQRRRRRHLLWGWAAVRA